MAAADAPMSSRPRARPNSLIARIVGERFVRSWMNCWSAPVRDHRIIGRYLRQVDSYLHVDRVQRRRILEEIEGHLHDAAQAHIAHGVDTDLAMEHATRELGSPAA